MIKFKNNTGVPIVLDGATKTIRLKKGEVFSIEESEMSTDIQNSIENGNILRIEVAPAEKSLKKGKKKIKEVMRSEHYEQEA